MAENNGNDCGGSKEGQHPANQASNGLAARLWRTGVGLRRPGNKPDGWGHRHADAQRCPAVAAKRRVIRVVRPALSAEHVRTSLSSNPFLRLAIVSKGKCQRTLLF